MAWNRVADVETERIEIHIHFSGAHTQPNLPNCLFFKIHSLLFIQLIIKHLLCIYYEQSTVQVKYHPTILDCHCVI